MEDPHLKRVAILIVLVLAILTASSYLFAKLHPLSTTPASALLAPVPPMPAPASPAMITWTPTSTEVIVSPGVTKSVSVTFIASRNIRRASVELSPGLVGIVTPVPGSFEKIRKGRLQMLSLYIAPTTSTALGAVTGTIQLRRGKVDDNDPDSDDEDHRNQGRLLPQPLKITVDVANRVTDPAAGFSILFPPSLYNLTDAHSPADSFSFESSPDGVAIGGAVEVGSPVATSGFAVAIDAKLFAVSSTFDIAQYLNSEYSNSAADANVTSITVCGKPGYEIFFSGEETGNWPVVIVFQNGRVYRFLYSSSDNLSDRTGLKAFNYVIANCTLQ